MRWLIGTLVLPPCLAAIVYLMRRLHRQFRSAERANSAREQFHFQREWLEVAFLRTLGRLKPGERSRWEAARWADDVVWARDRENGGLLALVAVALESHELFDFSEADPHHATVVFEFRKGRWVADGRCLDRVLPSDALRLSPSRFERLVLPDHRV